jgi:arginine repressor
MDYGAYWQLIDRLVASPKAYLRERCTHLELATGTKVSVATVCRAIQALNLTRTQVNRARSWWSRPRALP